MPRQSTDKLFTFGIYKSNGTSKVAEVKSGTNPTAYTTEKELEPGTYYVIVKKGDATNVESAVDYSINVMATEAQEIVATPVPTQEPEDVDTDDEQTGEDTEATAAPGAVATRQPITDDEEDTEESEPGAVTTRVPVVTVEPTEDEDDESEELPTAAPPIIVEPKPEKSAAPAVTKKPATPSIATEAPAPATNVPDTKVSVTPESGTNNPVTTAPENTKPSMPTIGRTSPNLPSSLLTVFCFFFNCSW